MTALAMLTGLIMLTSPSKQTQSGKPTEGALGVEFCRMEADSVSALAA
jgi:hypothetical protein